MLEKQKKNIMENGEEDDTTGKRKGERGS